MDKLEYIMFKKHNKTAKSKLYMNRFLHYFLKIYYTICRQFFKSNKPFHNFHK